MRCGIDGKLVKIYELRFSVCFAVFGLRPDHPVGVIVSGALKLSSLWKLVLPVSKRIENRARSSIGVDPTEQNTMRYRWLKVSSELVSKRNRTSSVSTFSVKSQCAMRDPMACVTSLVPVTVVRLL